MHYFCLSAALFFVSVFACRILALLEKFPSWDLSCLRVSQMFLDFDEGCNGVSAAFSADW